MAQRVYPIISTKVSGIDPADPIHPTNAEKRIVAEYGKSKALHGLKQAVQVTSGQFAVDRPE